MPCHAAETDMFQPNFSPALPISKLHEMYGHSSTGAPVLGHLLGRMSAGKSSIQAFGPTTSTGVFRPRQFFLSSRIQQGRGYTSHCELLASICNTAVASKFSWVFPPWVSAFTCCRPWESWAAKARCPLSYQLVEPTKHAMSASVWNSINDSGWDEVSLLQILWGKRAAQ